MTVIEQGSFAKIIQCFCFSTNNITRGSMGYCAKKVLHSLIKIGAKIFNSTGRRVKFHNILQCI